jgi:hypothetical protein
MGTLKSITNYNHDGTISCKRIYSEEKMFVIHFNNSVPWDSGWTIHKQKLYEGYIDKIEKIK